jgi:hypothetical protein
MAKTIGIMLQKEPISNGNPTHEIIIPKYPG